MDFFSNLLGKATSAISNFFGGGSTRTSLSSRVPTGDLTPFSTTTPGADRSYFPRMTSLTGAPATPISGTPCRANVT